MKPFVAYARYICNACGLVYDEARGDPDSGLAPGTRFVDIPDDWYCPLCGVGKADFSPWLAPGLDELRARVRSAVSPSPRNRRAGAGVLVIGAGRAGWQLAEALRAQDATLAITLVTACSGDIYDKPMLSVAMARRIAPAQLVRETGAAAASRLGVRLIAHTHAIRIDRVRRLVRTTRGNLPYAQLVLAHGAQAQLPAGLPPSLCWRINHLDDYQRLRARLAASVPAAPQDVVIVGAGLIGSELANDLALGGHRVTLLDMLAEPLARWQAEQAGAKVLQAWRALPIRFIGGVQVRSVRREAARIAIELGDGDTLQADQLIVAAGLQTPGRLARSAGLAWNQGVAVEPQTLRTSDPHIHALGDCITVDGVASRFIEPISRQVRTVVADICDDSPVPYQSRPAVVRVKTTSLPMTLH